MTAPAPRTPLMSLDEALAALIAAAVPVTDTETVPTMNAVGRVLARDLVSTLDVPPADNSAMDGYAVRLAELGGAPLPVSQRIPAGSTGQPLAAGTVARIFTGAPVPPGADAILMQEHAAQENDAIRATELPAPGAWIRRRGEDIAAGGTVLAAGTRLSPQATGLAASVGAATLDVTRRVRVACFSTGSELAMPGEPLPAGGIYNSNRFVLVNLLRGLGCEVQDLGIVPDTLAATRAALREAAATADLILTSGGVSVGEEDHVKPAVQAEGALALWQISMKPGKPLAFGEVRREAGRAHFIGLPGNPVSSFVTFLLLVRPFLARLQGAAHVAPTALMLPAGFDWPRPDRRREFLRVRIDEQGRLQPYPNQSSGVLTSTVWGDGLADIPAGHTVRAGDVLRFLSFASLGAC